MLEIVFSVLAVAAIGSNWKRKSYGSAVLLTFCLVVCLWLFSHSGSVQRNHEPVKIANQGGIRI